MATNVLDSPLEALVFNYASFGFFTIVNNLWTWVAVITAALSFWRIRAAGSVKSGPPSNPDTSQQPALGISPSDLTEEQEPAPAPVPARASSVCAAVGDVATKGKFTLYYEDDGESDGELTVVGKWDGGDDVEGIGVGGECCEDWMKTRMGDLGWYRFQDLTVLNGNVVRLWNGSGGKSSSSGCVPCMVVVRGV